MSVLWFAQLKSFIWPVHELPCEIRSILDQVFGDSLGRLYSLPVNIALQIYTIRLTSNIKAYGTLPLSDSERLYPRIRTVRLKKRRPGRPEHEYILVELVSGNGPLASDVVIGELKVGRDERAVYGPSHGNASKNASADRSASSTFSTRPGIFSRDYWVISTYIPPRDAATFKPDDTCADTTVFVYTFDEASAPSVSDLLVAASILSDDSPDYILSERQCFWYAGMLLGILLGDIDTDPLVQPTAQKTSFSTAFVLPDPNVRRPKPVFAGAAGTFKKLFEVVTKKDIDLLYNSEFRQAYQSQRAEVDEQLRAARMHEETARIWEETARIQEKNARMEEEIARMDEETARIWEETARIQEENARMDEEIARTRDELARLEAAQTERCGAPPHAQ
ncbi:hypothetical protein VTO73DRAFT_10850 [Trametes versicolor]